ANDRAGSRRERHPRSPRRRARRLARRCHVRQVRPQPVPHAHLRAGRARGHRQRRLERLQRHQRRRPGCRGPRLGRRPPDGGQQPEPHADGEDALAGQGRLHGPLRGHRHPQRHPGRPAGQAGPRRRRAGRDGHRPRPRDAPDRRAHPALPRRPGEPEHRLGHRPRGRERGAVPDEPQPPGQAPRAHALDEAGRLGRQPAVARVRAGHHGRRGRR
ncbi:MAG: hypothetical protein AVDCRST_MAG13-2019, partial [uncultured Solirubrobacteraceae bacterium]